jgi:hypothetical protein
MERQIKERESGIKPLVNVADENLVKDSTPFSGTNGSIELIDSILQARDELFDKQLSDGLESHRKLAGLLMK